MSGEAVRYLASRLVTTVLTVFGAMLLLFLLSVVVPGDPASSLLGPQVSPEAARLFVEEMGLNLPVHERLFHFFANVVSGDLGTDVASRRPVAALIWSVIPYTLILVFSAILL